MATVTAKAYRSPSLILLAMDWQDGESRNDFLGFAIRRTPGFMDLATGNLAATDWLPNRISFNGPPAAGQPDLLARAVMSEASDLGLGKFAVNAARGFLVQGEISPPQIEQIARELLADLVVERPVVGKPGEPLLHSTPHAPREESITRSVMPTIIHVLPKPGVTDPVAAGLVKTLAQPGGNSTGITNMAATLKQLTDFLVNLGIEQIAHTQKNYLAHLISVYKLMQAYGCEEDLCRAGLFHSIYGTEKFQGFKLQLD